jgi:aspartate aminotransferase-like enzyme
MADTTSEFQVWYTAPDGVRRSLNAIDEDGVRQIIADIKADEDKRHILAESVGLQVAAVDPAIEINQVTTTVKQFEL